MEELISRLPEIVIIILVLFYGLYLGPISKNALSTFFVTYKASELRKRILEAVIFAREQYETNEEVVAYVIRFIEEKNPNLDLDETEISQQILAVLQMLEKNLDVSRYISR